MALEDLGMFRSIPNCVVFYPSDGVSCERAVELAANYKDMAYIRATRGNTPIVYKNDEPFAIGKAKVIVIIMVIVQTRKYVRRECSGIPFLLTSWGNKNWLEKSFG